MSLGDDTLDPSNEETVTLTVKALRELLARQDRAMFVINLPYTNRHNYQRYFEIREVGRTNDDVELLFIYSENNYTKEEARVSISEIFNLMPNVQELIRRMALDAGT